MFTDDIIMYIENSKKSTKMIKTNKFSKLAGNTSIHKINCIYIHTLWIRRLTIYKDSNPHIDNPYQNLN